MHPGQLHFYAIHFWLGIIILANAFQAFIFQGPLSAIFPFLSVVVFIYLNTAYWVLDNHGTNYFAPSYLFIAFFVTFLLVYSAYIFCSSRLKRENPKSDFVRS